MHAAPRTTPATLGTSFALVASLGGSFLAGCGPSAADHARDQRRIIAAMTEAKDAVCACHDLICAEDAEEHLADFLLLHVDRLKKIPAPTPKRPDAIADTFAARAATLDGELRACKHRLEEAAHAS